jgi:hypothetical protein
MVMRDPAFRAGLRFGVLAFLAGALLGPLRSARSSGASSPS